MSTIESISDYSVSRKRRLKVLCDQLHPSKSPSTCSHLRHNVLPSSSNPSSSSNRTQHSHPLRSYLPLQSTSPIVHFHTSSSILSSYFFKKIQCNYMSNLIPSLQFFISFQPDIVKEKIRQQIYHFMLTYRGKKHRFSMIEILIAISIIVAFYGLTGTVFAQIYEQTKYSRANLDLNKIQDALVMYFIRSSRYPLYLEELLDNGDLNKIPKDPWGTDYLYIPHCDWERLSRIVSIKSASNAQQIQHFVETLKRMKASLSSLPESIDPVQILALSTEQPFCICIGAKVPLFPTKIETIASREKVRFIIQLIKMTAEKSASIPELHSEVKEIISLLGTQSNK